MKKCSNGLEKGVPETFVKTWVGKKIGKGIDVQ